VLVFGGVSSELTSSWPPVQVKGVWEQRHKQKMTANFHHTSERCPERCPKVPAKESNGIPKAAKRIPKGAKSIRKEANGTQGNQGRPKASQRKPEIPKAYFQSPDQAPKRPLC